MSHSGSGETGTGSIEVSVPTDLTVTSEGDSEGRRQNDIRKHAREVYSLAAEKNQLQHVIEKLRLELQEKDAQLVASKAQYAASLNQKDLQKEMKLSEKQANVNRLEAELLATNDELRLLKERAAKELAHLLQKCFEFQQNQTRLMVKHDEIKSSLNDLSLSEEEFFRIKNIPRDQLNLQQFVSLRVYEMVMPLKVKIKELETVTSSLQGTLAACEKELENKRRENAKTADEINHLREKLIDYSSQYEELRNEIKVDEYRIHNFDRIKRERDKYEEEREELVREKSEVELSAIVCKREKKILEERMAELKAKLRLQEQELSKYKHEYFDTKSQLEKGKEDTFKTSSRLKLEQERSEDIYERFLKARAEIISLSDSLQDAQNEVKSFKEKHSMTSKSERETKEELNQLQKRNGELSNDMEFLQEKYIKEKDALRLEISELRATYKSLSKTYNDLLENNAKVVKENQQSQSVLQEERLLKEREIIKLKQEGINLRRELDQYKALENDYVSTLKVFASVPDKGEASSESRIPASSIVRGKLSEETISLTRRILHLERQNVEACSTIKKFTITLDQIRSSLASYKAALAMAGRPSGQLLEKIRSQEEQILVLEEALRVCNESKDIILRDSKNLEEDLRNATSHLEDTKIQKEVVVSLEKEISNLRNWIVQKVNKGKEERIPTAIKITRGS